MYGGEGEAIWSFSCDSAGMLACLANLRKAILDRYGVQIAMRPPITYYFSVDKSDGRRRKPSYDVYFIDGGPIVEVTANLPQRPTVEKEELEWLRDGIEFIEIEGTEYGFVHHHSNGMDEDMVATRTLQIVEANYNMAKFLDTCFSAAGGGRTIRVSPPDQPTRTDRRVKFYAPNGGMYLRHTVWMSKPADDGGGGDDGDDGLPPICNGIRVRVTEEEDGTLNAQLTSGSTKPYY